MATPKESSLAETILGIIEMQADNPQRALVNIKRLCELNRLPDGVMDPFDYSGELRSSENWRPGNIVYPRQQRLPAPAWPAEIVVVPDGAEGEDA